MGDEQAAGAGVPVGIAGSFAAGARVGGYRLERPLGQGGMAAVYLARDDRLDRRVALKILAPALAADEGFRRRFIRESRAAAAVDHPHIIPVFDAGEADGLLYIAMRYVPGGDVGTIVRREGPLSPGRVAAVIVQVASALDAAHAAGLVHRDVKPANMLVDVGSGQSEHVYLSDFGLSKKTLTASAGLTGTGQFLGTLDYVAPEQIAGRPADGRTDQYALACAAFELLTGAPPFQREDAAAVMYAHLSEPPRPVTSWRADLPPGIDQVLARALAKEPASRYSSCQEFAAALMGALGTAPPRARAPASEEHEPAPYRLPPQAARVSGPPVPAAEAEAGPVRPSHAHADPPTRDAAIPAPVLAAADTVTPATQTAPAPTYSAPGPAPQLPTATATAAGPRSAGPSPSRAPRSRSRPWLLAAAATALVAGGATALTVSLSGSRAGLPGAPGSQSPASQPASKPAVSGPGAGSLAATLNNPKYQSSAVAFGPGAKTLAVGSNSADFTAGAIYLWDTATRKITATLTDPGSIGVSSVAFGPGGTILAAGDNNGSTYLWDTATGKITATLTDPGNGVNAVAFGPGGTILAAGDSNGSTYLWDTATGKITATLTDPGGKGVNAVAFGPGGTILAAGDSNGSTYLWDTATGKITATLTAPGNLEVSAVAFGPGARTLAVGSHNANFTGGAAYLWDIATRSITATLTDPGGMEVNSVAFAPGGTTLAAGELEGTDLWDIATGKLITTLTDPGGQTVNGVAFAPGGTTLATCDATGTYLWKITGRTS